MRRAWGPWRLDADRLVLDLYWDGDWTYQVDLEHCTSSAQMLDRIAQVRGKERPGPGNSEAEVVGYLVMALDDVLYLQATLCPGGRDRRMTRADIAERVKDYLQAGDR
jgi:tryptophanyl-tRNA synthetase